MVIGRNSLGAVWRKIMITPPNRQDLIDIVLQWYPELEYLAPKLIGLLNFCCSRITCASFHNSDCYISSDAFTRNP